MSGNNRRELLEILSRFAGGGVAGITRPAGDDAASVFREHLPVAEHHRALDRETLLVLGGRGTGKTQLFRALGSAQNPEDLQKLRGQRAPSTGDDRYIPGFTTSGTTFPAPRVVESVLARADSDPGHLWVGFLAGALLKDQTTTGAMSKRLGDQLVTLLQRELTNPALWLSCVAENVANVMQAFDDVETTLSQSQRFVIVIYDDLDVLASTVADVYPLVRKLLAFWLSNARRWRALRGKIFLRTDIFESEGLAFPDSSKLRPLSVTLRWNADNLYRLVLKRLLNGTDSEAWPQYIKRFIKSSKLKNRGVWGIVPETDERNHRSFMEQLVGKWMGSDKRRGDTYQWFLNHLQDSRGDIAPRSFLKLFELSGEHQLRTPGPPDDHLLSPEQIMGALSDVSMDRIQELGEEYTWIGEVSSKLKGNTVPMSRRDCFSLFRKIEPERLPSMIRSRPEQLVDYLMSLGILRETDDQRIHVPDIYLFGFEMKRKGGIRRPHA